MNTNSTLTYGIENGPSRESIFDSLKYAFDTEVKIPLDFTIIEGYTAPPSNPKAAYVIKDGLSDFRITSLEHEDGSGYSFNLTGYCLVKGATGITVGRKFEAYYNARTRKGTLRIKRGDKSLP